MQIEINKAQWIQNWGEDPGWRGFVGMIAAPAMGLSVLEFQKIAPRGVIAAEHHSYMSKDGIPVTFDFSIEGAQQLADQAETSALVFKQMGVDLIAICGTPTAFSMAGGYKASVEQVAKIEKNTGIPVVSMGLSLPFALNKLGAKTVAISCTHYSEAYRQGLTRFLEDAGFTVLGNENWVSQGFYASPELLKGQLTRRFPMSLIYRSIRKAAENNPTADCIIGSGGAVFTLDIIDALEKDTRKPVISSTSAFLYQIFSRLGVWEGIPNRGSLLRSLDDGPSK
ncbi:hypothetical protein ACFLWF_00530 [Chloroflexota bacterium]